MTTAIIGPITAAILTAIVAGLVADLLTVTGRLRRKLEKDRKLEKELSICAKLPAGPPKEELNKIVRRQTLELIWRERNRDRTRAQIGVLISTLGGMAVVLSGLVNHLRHPNAPSGLPPDDPTIVVFPFLFFFLALLLFREARNSRNEYLVQMDREPYEPSGLVSPIIRTWKLRAPLAAPSQPSRSTWWARRKAATGGRWPFGKR